ncbi:hypothetical protein CDL12_11116 [Handroanthus impetiginosus]|uniref:Response regulatory domain-containing protein n=1 Tax=Handroanthus impetiginosus TaxID=429701 RepID=A0A2G9HFC9_9LAMI|nr:hypothetical protein CDL12_11116 [Handroanthus impetiginosus]
MGTKGTCILLVNNDLTCNRIVHEMLQHCNHKVLHIGGVMDVLNAIWEKRDMLDLVLTNAHKLESNGTEVIQHIQKKLNLPIILMCPDKNRITSKGQPFSFAAYVLNGLSRNDVNNLWQHALEKESHKLMAAYQQENAQEPSMANNVVKTNKTYSSTSDATRFNHKRKRNELAQKIEKSDQDDKEDPPVAKKPRVVWTMEMHQKFLEAIDIIGYDKAVPKKIVEVMGIPGLTRENVASHLQKFRGNIKRIQETAYGSSTTSLSNGLCVSPSPSVSRFNVLQRNITPLWESSYISHSKESMSTYLADQLQQSHVSALQAFPNHRIYGDKMRSMLLRVCKNSSFGDCNKSNTSKFVGYRLTSDGNSIEFGEFEDEISRDSLISSLGISERHSMSYVKHVGDSSQELALHPLQSPSIQPVRAETLENTIRTQNLSENDILVHNSLTFSTTCQDYLMPSLEIPGDELLFQNSVAFSEGTSEQHYSSPSLPEMLQHLDEFLDIGGIDVEGTSSGFDEQKHDHKHDD